MTEIVADQTVAVQSRRPRSVTVIHEVNEQGDPACYLGFVRPERFKTVTVAELREWLISALGRERGVQQFESVDWCDYCKSTRQFGGRAADSLAAELDNADPEEVFG